MRCDIHIPKQGKIQTCYMYLLPITKQLLSHMNKAEKTLRVMKIIT
jgi:hypothetical protein